MKLFSELIIDEDIKFKKMRKTTTNTKIIDIDTNLFQTCWLQVIDDVDNIICVNNEKIKDILKIIDTKIIEYTSQIFDFSVEEISNMYRPLLKSSDYFVIPMNSKTVMYCNESSYTKSEIKDVLNKEDNVRFIMSFKKICLKDYEIIVYLELQQIEMA
jgi:hypothetical protein